MKKIIQALLVVAILLASCFSFVACSTANDSEQQTGISYKKYKGEDFYTVHSYVDDGKTTAISIPDVKDGIPVGRIAAGAFDGCSLVSIEVPTSVTEIGEGAFKNTKKLQSLTLPFIGKNATADAYLLESGSSEDKSIDASRTISYLFGEEEYDLGIKITNNYSETASSVCYVPQTLTKINIKPAKEYSIPMYAFSGLVNLRQVELADNIKAIGEGAFSGCLNLKDITIPSAVTKIYDSAFKKCTNLNTEKLFADNSNLESIGAFAFAETKFTNITLPNTVKVIGESCFADSYLNTLVLPQSLTDIEYGAFSKCINLVSLDSSNVANKINLGIHAFYNCNKLTNSGIDLTDYSFDMEKAENYFAGSGISVVG